MGVCLVAVTSRLCRVWRLSEESSIYDARGVLGLIVLGNIPCGLTVLTLGVGAIITGGMISIVQ